MLKELQTEKHVDDYVEEGDAIHITPACVRILTPVSRQDEVCRRKAFIPTKFSLTVSLFLSLSLQRCGGGGRQVASAWVGSLRHGHKGHVVRDLEQRVNQ